MRDVLFYLHMHFILLLEQYVSCNDEINTKLYHLIKIVTINGLMRTP